MIYGEVFVSVLIVLPAVIWCQLFISITSYSCHFNISMWTSAIKIMYWWRILWCNSCHVNGDVRYNNNAPEQLNDCIRGILHLGPNVITFRLNYS